MGGDSFHIFHGQLIVVGGQIGIGINRRQLMLSRSRLVMFRFGVDSQLPQLLIQLRHKSLHSWLNSAEIVVIHFLPFWWPGSKQGTSSINQIRALVIQRFIH